MSEASPLYESPSATARKNSPADFLRRLYLRGVLKRMRQIFILKAVQRLIQCFYLFPKGSPHHSDCRSRTNHNHTCFFISFPPLSFLTIPIINRTVTVRSSQKIKKRQLFKKAAAIPFCFIYRTLVYVTPVSIRFLHRNVCTGFMLPPKTIAPSPAYQR